jgi:hypothetical protein
MYKVKYENKENEFVTLDEALKFSRELNCFVSIQGNGMELVGIFGADEIKDGKLPDGTNYTWKKRRI